MLNIREAIVGLAVLAFLGTSGAIEVQAGVPSPQAPALSHVAAPAKHKKHKHPKKRRHKHHRHRRIIITF